MQITQVRNATQIIEYASARFLIDPMLSPKDAFPAFAGTPNEERRNPTVELPFALDRILDVDAVIVTHTHMDHWDPAASAALAKAIPLFVQNEKDAEKLRGEGFTDVRLLTNDSRFGAIRLTKTPGQHGSDEAIRLLGQRLGEVCGVAFRHEGERSLYLAGDTVWKLMSPKASRPIRRRRSCSIAATRASMPSGRSSWASRMCAPSRRPRRGRRSSPRIWRR